MHMCVGGSENNFVEVGFLLSCGLWDQTQVVRLGRETPLPLSHLTCLLFSLFSAWGAVPEATSCFYL